MSGTTSTEWRDALAVVTASLNGDEDGAIALLDGLPDYETRARVIWKGMGFLAAMIQMKGFVPFFLEGIQRVADAADGDQS